MEELKYSELIYRGKIFNIRRDTLTLKSGREVLREVVEHRGAVAIIPLLDTDKLVLVKQYRHPTRETLIELPAGTLEEGETPLACAKRELLEETGYEAGEIKELFKCYLAPGYSTELMTFFLARDLKRKKTKREPDEDIEVLVVDLAKAIHMIKKGDIRDAKSICGILYLITMRNE